MSRATAIFGSNVFDDRVMEAVLPTDSYHALRKAMKKRAVEAYNKEMPRPSLTSKSII
ncbi:glutamine synthetase III [Massilicoli timonensis]|uniref:glutamine synthetase III n=1 Tax=Massilicoli timonensis TaxID=2015901 RepID=UPI0011AF193E|nr:glutamine synthetase III [Massilicoli timonensis]